MICVVIPTLNSEVQLESVLGQLSMDARIVVTDGGSSDNTLVTAARGRASLCLGCPGRGTQLIRGCRWALGASWLLILHADTDLPDNLETVIRDHIERYPGKAAYFDLKFDSSKLSARIIEWLVILRCRWFGLPYGDQGLLIPRILYDEIGGYENIPLFEDVALVKNIGKKRLKRLGASITTSATKFERDGFFRRGWYNFILLRRYLRGESPHDLAKDYS